MPRQRSNSSLHLPPYVMRRSGRFYLEPKGVLRDKLNGKASIPLGGTYIDMFAEYKKIMDSIDARETNAITSMNQLIDRYLLEVTPTKAESGHRQEHRRAELLKNVFGPMHPGEIQKVDIYAYIDWRSKKAPVGVNREIALLSAVFRKAERWGVISDTPCQNIEYNREEARTRYITHDEYQAFHSFSKKKNPVVAAYMDFKYVTGLRAADIRALKKRQLTSEGILLTISKSRKKRKKPVLIVWSATLKLVTEKLMEACARDNGKTRVKSDYVLHTRQGTPYTDDGWRAVFYRQIRAAMEQGVLEETFCDHDIRAKAGSDQEEASKFRKKRLISEKIKRVNPLKLKNNGAREKFFIEHFTCTAFRGMEKK